MRYVTLLGAFAFSVIVQPAAQAADEQAAQDIRAYAHEVMDTLGIAPGVAIAVVRGSQPVYVETFGQAASEPLVPADNQSLFYLASSTKPFTGLMVASLGRKGLVDLDAPIARWLPKSGLPSQVADTTTLRDLVSLRSGVENDPLTFRSAFTGDLTSHLRQTLLARSTATGGPKTTFQYSNAGFNIATALLERKFGKTWQQLVQREVLQPAGLTSTTPWPSRAARAGKVLSSGHLALTTSPKQAELQKGDAMMQSAGGLYTTAPDLARWLSLQLGDGVVGGRRYFPAGLVSSTHVPLVPVNKAFGDYRRDSYGMGWYIGSKDKRELVHAFGSFIGNWSHVSFSPSDNVGVAVLVNEEVFGGQVAELISDFAYDRLAGKPGLPAIHAERLRQTKLEVAAAREAIGAEEKKRASRTWQLTRPYAAYAGRFDNADYGRITVTARVDGLDLRFGQLHASAEPYPAPDTMRVAFEPTQGRLVRFSVDAKGDVNALDYGDIPFKRAAPKR